MSLKRRSLLFGVTAAFAIPQRPNIIFILSDDQGYGDLSLHGNPVLKTPHLDSIGKSGVQFTQFHVNPVCSPTRSSLLTGRYYYRTGVVDTFLGRSMMHADEVTLAEMLRGSGYHTGIFGKWHLGDHYPLRAMDQGFEEAVTHDGGGIAQPSDPPGGNTYLNPKLKHNGREYQAEGYCTDVFFNHAMRFIEANRHRPFFAYIAPNAPHTPLQVEDRWVEPYRGRGLDPDTERVYGMVSNLDDNTGRLLAHIDRLGLAENTILIFMTDNGPQQRRFNAGMRGLKGTVYQGGIRVPCFLRWPKVVRPGTKIDQLAAHIDFVPTVLDLCGVTAARGRALDGRSLAPLIRSPETVRWADRTVYFQWHRGDRGELYRDCAARSQQYKLVNGRELYDLEADPAEARDIAAANPTVVARMREGYEAWFHSMENERHWESPRIWLGTKQENPVLLTRQDWRGPKAGSAADSKGYWDVDVRTSGNYSLRVMFAPLSRPARITASLGGVTAEASAAAGAKEVRLSIPRIPAGPSRLEADIGGRGATYVEVLRD